MDAEIDRLLLERLGNGDSKAAHEIVHAYAARMAGLCRGRIAERMSRRIDPEDVVQSAFRSFFRRAADGNYSLDDGQPLWNLLATITINKLRHRREFHLALKRSVEHEQSISAWDALAGNPADDETAANLLLEELKAVLEEFEPKQREIAAMKLDGHTNDEIAAATGRTDRTVRRVLERVWKQLEERASDGRGA